MLRSIPQHRSAGRIPRYTARVDTESIDGRPRELGGIPPAVRRLVARLDSAGHPSYLVGGCVRDLLRGQAVEDFDVATPAAPDAVLELFPRAVPIGLRHGTVMVPTPSGPVDVTSFRAGPRLEDDLSRRDFTVNAMAYDLRTGRLVDRFDGRTDLAKGALRAVGSARDRFAEDPLRALRAARLLATLGLEIDGEVERAMPGAIPGLRRVARERVRHELAGMLLAPHVADALALLRRTGIEQDLAPGAAPDAGPVVAALPFDFDLRLAGWLRGARAASVLQRLRFSRRAVDRVARLLRLHPVEAGVDPSRDAAVRRLLKRAGEEEAAGLIALRRAELRCGQRAGGERAKSALTRLDALEAAIERLQRSGALALRRFDLAIDGKQVMEILACEAGPQVGRALRHLTDQVVEDPSRNTPEALRALLEGWARRQP